MNLDFIQGVQILIIAFLSYIISITFAGFFESYIAKKVGDDTPELSGFLTLNPLDHFNVFGFAAVLWGLFYGQLLPFQLIPGWGRLIPLLPDNIQGRNRKLRVFMEFTARSCAHFILLITTFITYSVCFNFAMHSSQFFMAPSQTTSFIQSIMTLLSFIYHQNVILFTIHFVVGLFQFLFHVYGRKFHYLSTIEKIIIGFIAIMIALVILIPLLANFVTLSTALIEFVIFKIRLCL